MANIFISHSSKDKEIIDFFNKAFANSKVRALYEEFEQIIDKTIDAEKIQADINVSNAVFILLSSNTEMLPHTRDWVLWESGVSSNKDIWVFVPADINTNLSIVIPKLSHLVLYNIDQNWLKYIFQIVQSYDDSNILPVTLATGGLGAMVGGAISEEDRSGGAVIGSAIGGLGGIILHEIFRPKAPQGYAVRCLSCSSFYHLHSRDLYFRCPVCNTILQININKEM